ncbi:MAG: radical SAM protein [Solobacterium sp.]|nr:radical SAM protein [Solobacterium sp.]
MNPYLKNLNRIEFVVTDACTGKCIHCQQGSHERFAGHIDAGIAVDAVRKICANYTIESLMTFGGESLLFPDIVCQIQRAAAELGIPQRQIITSGYFSVSHQKTEETVRNIADSGVNDLLLSVDAFHQETIPLEPVLYFAECCVRYKIPIRLSPAWLVSPQDQNLYNIRTRKILQEFESLHIPMGSGDIVFPSGNARIYLKEYFDEDTPESSPYDEDPEDIRSISFSADGTVLNGSVYTADILEIIKSYRP